MRFLKILAIMMVAFLPALMLAKKEERKLLFTWKVWNEMDVDTEWQGMEFLAAQIVWLVYETTPVIAVSLMRANCLR